MAGKSVVQKLGIQPGFRILRAGVPAAYSAIVGKLSAGVTIVSRLNALLDMVHLFATEAAGLAGKMARTEICDSQKSADRTQDVERAFRDVVRCRH